MKYDWTDLLLMVFVGWVAGMGCAALLVSGDTTARAVDVHRIQALQTQGICISVDNGFRYWGWDNVNHVSYPISRDMLTEMAKGK